MPLRAAILSIGDELLRGEILDRNAAYLCERLSRQGYEVAGSATAGDRKEQILAALRYLWESGCDLLLATGGLGPTRDDATRFAFAEHFQLDLVLHPQAMENLRALFGRLGRDVSTMQQVQAMLPAGATYLPNPAGTACGFLVEEGGRQAAALPGPPGEMRVVFEALSPLLRGQEAAVAYATVRTILLPESKVERAIRALDIPGVTMNCLLHDTEVHVKIKSTAEPFAKAIACVERARQAVRQRIGEHAYEDDDQTIEALVLRRLREKRASLAVAESCTGGLLGYRLTEIAGASALFRGGVVCYSNEAKQEILGVPARLIETHGAVSEQVAAAMAEGARCRFRSDLAVGITGIAGPTGGSEAKPVGLTYVGLADKNGSRAERFVFGGDRGAIRRRAADAALWLLSRALCP